MENKGEVLFEEREKLVKKYPELEQDLKKYQADLREFEKMKVFLPEDRKVEDYFLFGAKFGIE